MTSPTANQALIDTSVYIENFRFGRFETELLNLRFLVRCSAVVLAELWRGARSREAKRFVTSLGGHLRVIAPNERRAAMRYEPEVTHRDFLKRGSGSVALSLVISASSVRLMPTVEAAPKAVPLFWS